MCNASAPEELGGLQMAVLSIVVCLDVRICKRIKWRESHFMRCLTPLTPARGNLLQVGGLSGLRIESPSREGLGRKEGIGVALG